MRLLSPSPHCDVVTSLTNVRKIFILIASCLAPSLVFSQYIVVCCQTDRSNETMDGELDISVLCFRNMFSIKNVLKAISDAQRPQLSYATQLTPTILCLSSLSSYYPIYVFEFQYKH